MLSSQNISLPYGKTRFDLALDADWILPPPSAPAADESAAVYEALRRPIGAPPLEEEWFFGGFARNGATMTPLDIVGVGKTNQRVNRPEKPGGYEYQHTPSPTKPEDITVLLTSAAAKAAAPADVEKALGAFARIENPQKYGPDQLPCAGCHMTTFVTEYAKTNLGLDVSQQPDAFKSTRDLTVRGEAATTASSLRAFGFLGAKPMIAKRVVHETAAILDDLEKRFPLAK